MSKEAIQGINWWFRQAWRNPFLACHKKSDIFMRHLKLSLNS